MSDEPELLRRRLARERAARREAEAIAERTTRTLYDRQRELELLGAVAGAANHAESIDAALAATLGAACRHTGWPVGHAWMREGDELVTSGVWHLEVPGSYRAFRTETAAISFPIGEGLPGHVVATGEPLWVPDLAGNGLYPRSGVASSENLHSAVGLPVRAGLETVGVLEFLTPQIHPPDEALLRVLAIVASHAGRAIERLRAQAELSVRAAALERSNAELETFAYVASHDLREPLRTVSGFIGLLERRYQGRLGDDADEFIAFALDGTARMQRLIDDLLLYSRSTRFEISGDPVDTSAIAVLALETLAETVEETGAEILLAGDLPVVPGSATELERVFVNLIGNALKFRRPAVRPRVTVGAEAVEDGQAWRFTIADNGIGIDPRHRERVFEMFQRLHTQDSYPGTGIGLAICQRVVERHGGTIRVHDGPEGGTAFVFDLPVRPARSP